MSQLGVLKVLLQKVAKYLLLPGLSVDLNINSRIVTLNGEIVVALETPDPNLSTDRDLDRTNKKSGLNAENLAAMSSAVAVDQKVKQMQEQPAVGDRNKPTEGKQQKDSSGGAADSRRGGESGGVDSSGCALVLNAEFSLQEMIDDIVEMTHYVQRLTVGTDTEAALGKASNDGPQNSSHADEK